VGHHNHLPVRDRREPAIPESVRNLAGRRALQLARDAADEVEERYCAGDADPYGRFLARVQTVPYAHRSISRVEEFLPWNVFATLSPAVAPAA
jgi:hypothetical protein